VRDESLKPVGSRKSGRSSVKLSSGKLSSRCRRDDGCGCFLLLSWVFGVREEPFDCRVGVTTLQQPNRGSTGQLEFRTEE